MKKFLSTLVRNEKGQAMTEYGLILGLIAIVVVGALIIFGETLLQKFNEVITSLGGTPGQ